MKAAAVFLSRLTLRERVLAGIALALAGSAGLYYGVFAPGLTARASAQSRYDRAAADLAEARSLAQLTATRAPAREDLEKLTTSAAALGLTVTSSDITDGAAVLYLSASGAPDVLAWAAAASNSILPLRSLTVRRDGAGPLMIEAIFTGTGT